MSAIKLLTGTNILVTRPVHQADCLADGIRAMGGNPILFPVLEITDITDIRPLQELINHLDAFDLAIFVSPNAINKAMPLILMNRALPPNLKIAVVGKSSADTLKEYGIHKVIMPTQRFDSEALLDEAELQQINNKRVVIFRGDDGRKLLGETLIKRGAILEYVTCYHRRKPFIDTGPLLTTWSQGKLNAVTITSSEGLHNLFDMIGEFGQQLLKRTPLFTAHARIAQVARDLGLDIVITTSAGDKGLLQGLLEYFQASKNQI
ncbi:uroporphyrinogen-III synthase [Nitrosomonas cryotolerans]|uniref:Uroporphyrinogen-III synthase n=1 Tax=Nitrosomonas cryotolerans ATCC 49181 TaxID=1131553 RepID=A0A1N6FFI3_9PROT|nr:uroporphyrinogen-III synthase [Nitrosomonas cryotolerans]SFP63293.1 uroporphyrinogen-III synthase [Nitrosomonas cryotolerans]SIN93964.1 uroporphyrinogen-III synthase [Nitrosomonas cryotolerans ATCC 49181]